jgi:hypothetical protein
MGGDEDYRRCTKGGEEAEAQAECCWSGSNLRGPQEEMGGKEGELRTEARA